MSAIDARGSSDLDLPLARKTYRLVHVSVQCEQWLLMLDETPHGDASDVHVEWNMLVELAVKGRTVQ